MKILGCIITLTTNYTCRAVKRSERELTKAAPKVDAHVPSLRVLLSQLSLDWYKSNINPAHGQRWLFCQLSFSVLHQVSPGYHQKWAPCCRCKWCVNENRQKPLKATNPPLLDSIPSEGESEDRHSADYMNSFCTCPPFKLNQYDAVIKASRRSLKSTE